MVARRLAALLCGALAVGAAGCGDSKPPKTTSTGSIDTRTHVSLKNSLLGGAQSAGVAAGYVAKGAIVADSGFRPGVDGFAFENYGNDAGPVNLTPANVEHIFGNQVCAAGTGDACVPIPTAKQWMNTENEGMGPGHCMGFSVSALRFFTKNLDPARFGANRTIDLPVQGNTSLQSLIGEDFSYQTLPAVTDRTVTGTPAAVLHAVQAALKKRREAYTLAIFKADGTGGHAVTPFAVEDRGGGRAAILVYDNNFPGAVRKVDVDTGADTWHYVGRINPSDASGFYTGDARTKSMFLMPTSPGEGRQPCPFCTKAARSGPDPRYLVPDRLHYIEVVLGATGANHPHLVFAEDQGRRTGFVAGRFRHEVPGIKVVQNVSVSNWRDGDEPKFRLPLGHPSYYVTVDGSTLSKPVKTRISINGSGAVFYVDDIRMKPGQKDVMEVPRNAYGVTYASSRRFPGTPTVAVQFPQFDRRHPGSNGHSTARLITLATGALGFPPNTPVGLLLLPRSGTALINGGVRAKALAKQAGFLLSVDSAPVVRGQGLPDQGFGVARFSMDPSRREVARFHYLRPTGRRLPVDIVDGDTFKFRRRESIPAH